MPRTVDPNRFRGEPMMLHRIGDDDYSVVIDDLRAGRILHQVRAGSRETWLWTVTGPYLGKSAVTGSGEAHDLQTAKTEFRAAL